jgi:hypothetical protein
MKAPDLKPGDVILWPPSLDQWLVTESHPDDSRPASAGTWRLVATRYTGRTDQTEIQAGDVSVEDDFPMVGWSE